MRYLVLLLLLAQLACGEQPASKVVVLANSIDGGMGSGLYQQLEGGGAAVIKSDASAFEIVKDSPLVIILGGQNSPEGIGGFVDRLLSADEKASLMKPGAFGTFKREGVFASGQVIFIFAGFGADDTRQAWHAGLEQLTKAVEAGAQRSLNMTAPATLLIAPVSNNPSVSFPVNLSNTGQQAISGLKVEAYLNGGIRLTTEPETIDLPGGSSQRVMVKLNPKNVTTGDVVSVEAAGLRVDVRLNVTAYQRNDKICNICAAGYV